MYSVEFYEASRSQGVVAGSVLRAFLERAGVGVDSVVDIGGGLGGWLEAFAEGKCTNAILVDNLDHRIVSAIAPEISYVQRDLELGIGDIQNLAVDLVICVEVAEHLSHAVGNLLVSQIAQMSDLVVWSAAWPGQGGEFHVNEQSPAFWYQRFVDHGYSVIDCLRGPLGEVGAPRYYRTNPVLLSRNPEVTGRLLSAGDIRYHSNLGIVDQRSATEKVAGVLLRRLPMKFVSSLASTRRRLG
jgi:hypothetical protein